MPDDTSPTRERDFVRAYAPQGQAISTVLQDYAIELKGTVSRNFTVPPEWSAETMRRLAKADVEDRAEV